MTPESIQGRRLNVPVELMRFTLTYDGPLHAVSDGNKRTAEKQAIRECFHHQLVDLWRSHPVLKSHFESWKESSEDQKQNNRARRDILIKFFDREGCRFVPLVTRAHHLNCEINILFLRREPPTSVYLINHAGDLDNRLKLLFDALSVRRL